MSALVGVQHEVKIGRLQVDRPSLCHSVNDQGLEVLHEMSVCIIGVDHLEGLIKRLSYSSIDMLPATCGAKMLKYMDFDRQVAA